VVPRSVPSSRPRPFRRRRGRRDGLANQSCLASASVAAGSDLTVSLPAGSRFRALGVADLTHSAVSLQLPGEAIPPSTPAVAAAVWQGPDSSSVRLAVPSGTAAGRYLFTAVMSSADGQVLGSQFAYVDVVTPAVNPGLRSETGGDDGSTSLLPVALSALAAAGVAVRVRRRTPLTD